tara:strand:+ start:4545 stop:5198 length:654 start_codon:yes stop_codon:yes gene_type:complete
MDPITIAILSATAGTAISSLPSLIGGKQHRSNKKRLEELEKRRAAGGLGLSGKEEAAMSGKLRSTADQASEQMEQRQKQLLAGGGQASGGQALASSLGLQQERMALETDVNQQILEADEAEKQRELEELYGLEAAVAEKRNQRVQAAANIAGSAVEAGFSSAAQQAVIQGQKDISPEKVSGLASQLGVSDEEARGIYEMSLENPEILRYISAQNRGQ